MSMREQMKVIVEEIRDECDKEILEFIEKEISSTIFMIELNEIGDLINDKYYWLGRKTQAEVIKDFIINGKDDIK